MSKGISFKVTRKDAKIINAIVQRAVTIVTLVPLHPLCLSMDLTATHANGCPLRLDDLLRANDSSFAHDVFGIQRHIDRRSGKLMDCFWPRFAKPEKRRKRESRG